MKSHQTRLVTSIGYTGISRRCTSNTASVLLSSFEKKVVGTGQTIQEAVEDAERNLPPESGVITPILTFLHPPMVIFRGWPYYIKREKRKLSHRLWFRCSNKFLISTQFRRITCKFWFRTRDKLMCLGNLPNRVSIRRVSFHFHSRIWVSARIQEAQRSTICLSFLNRFSINGSSTVPRIGNLGWRKIVKMEPEWACSTS